MRTREVFAKFERAAWLANEAMTENLLARVDIFEEVVGRREQRFANVVARKLGTFQNCHIDAATSEDGCSVRPSGAGADDEDSSRYWNRGHAGGKKLRDGVSKERSLESLAHAPSLNPADLDHGCQIICHKMSGSEG